MRRLVELVSQDHSFDQDIFENFTSGVAEHMDNEPFETLEDVWRQTELFDNQRAAGEDMLFCIVDAANGRFLGQLAIMGCKKPFPEIGIWVSESEQGKGVATAAIQRFGKLFPGYRGRLLYPVRRENTASIRLAEKLSSSQPAFAEGELTYTV